MPSDSAPQTAKPPSLPGHSECLFALALLAATLIAYYPAWFGKPIWDDAAHMTSPELSSWAGLWRVWTQPGTTQQYYPLVHSVFWLEYKIWGNATPGYHLVNILLHVFCALLLLRILRLLEVPGAWLAAAIFALHPIEVESVAWISELKNTLSGAFYLGAALACLRFDRERGRRLYLIALGLFIAGLFCKTVIATLPAALLVVFWWKRGRISWRRDVLPLVPFFAAGIAMGFLTAYVESQYVIGPDDSAFHFTAAQRCLIAGRAFWFYIGKILWPAKLIFIYPRWEVDQGAWWQWLFPMAMLALFAALWVLRKRTRAPLAAALFYGGTLFPALGFVNVYPFIFSFVADHFQYLAGIGIIVPAAATTTLLAHNMGNLAARVAATLILPVLAALSWRQCGIYTDPTALYTNTIRFNPDCWMAYNNLGTVYQDQGQLDMALGCFQKALLIRPDYPSALSNLGFALHQQGHVQEAIIKYQQALELKPGLLKTELNLAIALRQEGKMREALAHFQKAVEIHPESAVAQNDLGQFLRETGGVHEAIEHLQLAVEIDPDYAEAHENLGLAFYQDGNMVKAIEHFRKALEIKPNYTEASHYLALALEKRGTGQ